MTNYLLPWRKFADFSGRAPQGEYWVFTLINHAVLVILNSFQGVLSGASTSTEHTIANVLLYVIGGISLVLLLPSLAVGARRLHDSDRSGWWVVLVMIVPFLALYFMTREGTDGENRYGLPRDANIAGVF